MRINGNQKIVVRRGSAIGGPAVLAQILSSTPATTNAARYARIVEEFRANGGEVGGSFEGWDHNKSNSMAL